MNKIIYIISSIFLLNLIPVSKSISQEAFNLPDGFENKVQKIMINKSVLVYTKNGEGYVHENIPANVEAIEKLGEKYNFNVDVSDDPAVFTKENIEQYVALIFANSNNEAFDTEEQKSVFQNYIRSGGGFVAIHSACASERKWPWFWKNVGGLFIRHAPFQEFDVKVVDDNHISTAFLPKTWTRPDECYYVHHINPDIHVLLAADMTTVEDKGKAEYPGTTFGDTFPLAWYHEFEGGRQWFTALGHSPEDYSDPLLVNHILGGIVWAVGD